MMDVKVRRMLDEWQSLQLLDNEVNDRWQFTSAHVHT